MLYYLFSCGYCQHSETIKGEKSINEIRKTGYHTCPNCNGHQDYSHSNVIDNDDPNCQSAYGSMASVWGIQNDAFPSQGDFQLSDDDDEGLPEWQQYILSSLVDSHEYTYDSKAMYESCLKELKQNQFAWVKFGFWAFQFKAKRFYKEHYKTWQQFCEKVLHQSHWYVDKIIKASRVIKDLICAGFTVLPQNEYQARYLTKFWGDELIEKWQMIVDAVEPHLITSDLIKSRFCRKEKKDERWIKVDSGLLEEFEYKARERGLNPREVLEGILDSWHGEDEEPHPDDLDDDEVEDVPTEKLEAWATDLQELIREKHSSDHWFTKLIFWSLFNDKKTYFSGIP
ncbi:MAG: hypothetical protein QNJ64_08395 [Crocosphaera sp.]|nr:hypothetical protein [Crocosphaera sp.]